MENLQRFQYAKEPNVPFPQADDFEKCVTLLNLLKEWVISKDYILKNFGFTDRQVDYYVNACKYLWCAESVRAWGYTLSELWKQIVSLSDKEKKLSLIMLILSHQVFNEVYQEYSKSSKLSKADITPIMKKCNLYKVESEDTYERRASTILSWCERIENTAHEEWFIFRIYCAQWLEFSEATKSQKELAVKIAKQYNRENEELLITIIEAIIAFWWKASYSDQIYPYIERYYPEIYNKYKSISGVVNSKVQTLTKWLSGFSWDEIFIHEWPWTYSLKDYKPL